MLTLVLIRHAKSDWADPNLSDHDRPLNDRGRHNAPMMAHRFAETGLHLERIISSTATRARTTAHEFGAALGIEVELDAELYASSATTMMNKAAASGVQSVMLVAHDPGITYLAERLSRGGITHMPTCAVATFSWDTSDWQSIAWDEAVDWRLDTVR